jgi:hypothetical protein
MGYPGKLLQMGELNLPPRNIRTIIELYHIKHRITMPYHPWANGKVEGTNKILENILTKTVQLHLKDWEDKLPDALWAYITTW